MLNSCFSLKHSNLVLYIDKIQSDYILTNRLIVNTKVKVTASRMEGVLYY